MAQRSVRRDRENQYARTCLEHAALIWTRSANSHTGPRRLAVSLEAGRMTASDHVPETILTFSACPDGRVHGWCMEAGRLQSPISCDIADGIRGCLRLTLEKQEKASVVRNNRRLR